MTFEALNVNCLLDEYCRTRACWITKLWTDEPEPDLEPATTEQILDEVGVRIVHCGKLWLQEVEGLQNEDGISETTYSSNLQVV
nr:hypothetical transcript [Hymenolepis microstoma]